MGSPKYSPGFVSNGQMTIPTFSPSHTTTIGLGDIPRFYPRPKTPRYNGSMRYRLRTLVILTVVGPPLLAVAW